MSICGTKTVLKKQTESRKNTVFERLALKNQGKTLYKMSKKVFVIVLLQSSNN